MTTYVDVEVPRVSLDAEERALDHSEASELRVKPEESDFREQRESNLQSEDKRSEPWISLSPTSWWFTIVLSFIFVVILLSTFHFVSNMWRCKSCEVSSPVGGSNMANDQSHVPKFLQKIMAESKEPAIVHQNIDALDEKNEREGVNDGEGDEFKELIDSHVTSLESMLEKFNVNFREMNNDLKILFSQGLMEIKMEYDEKLTKVVKYFLGNLTKLSRNSKMDHSVSLTESVDALVNATKVLRSLKNGRLVENEFLLDRMKQLAENVSLGFEKVIRFLKESREENPNFKRGNDQLQIMGNLTISAAEALETSLSRQRFQEYRNPSNPESIPIESDQIKFSQTICVPNGACYEVSLNASAWSEARDQCHRLGSRLVHINGLAENAEMEKLGSEEFWIGGRYLRNGWKWIGTNETSEMEFTDWRDGKNETSQGSNLCAKYQSVRATPRKWKPADCYHRKQFVCEFQTENGSSDNSISRRVCVDSDRVRVSMATECFAFVQTQLVRDDAENFCRERLNGSLANLDAMGKRMSLFAMESQKLRPGSVWRTRKSSVPLIPSRTSNLTFHQPERSKGKIEGLVKYNDYFVAAEGWDENDAKVACRELGLPYIELLKKILPLTRANKKLVQLICTGDEQSLAECQFEYDYDYYSDYYYDYNDFGRVSDVLLAGAICGTSLNVFGFGETNGNWKYVFEERDDDWEWFVCQLNDDTNVG